MNTQSSVADLQTRVALVTGGSRGLGRALTTELVRRGWHVVIDARDAHHLAEVVAGMPSGAAPDTSLSSRSTSVAAGGDSAEGSVGVVAGIRSSGRVTGVAGDVADPAHRRDLAAAVVSAGGLDLLVNNASVLGLSPQPALAAFPLEVLEHVYAVNTLAPLGLLQLVLPELERRHGRVVNVSSDAAVEAYEGWGGYGSAKAALDHISAVLAVEHPGLHVYALDPGDMATDLQQQAFPGEDISDRATPETVVPALLRLIEDDLPSGRYRAADLQAPGTQQP